MIVKYLLQAAKPRQLSAFAVVRPRKSSRSATVETAQRLSTNEKVGNCRRNCERSRFIRSYFWVVHFQRYCFKAASPY